MADTDPVTVRIEVEGEENELELPGALVELVAEEGQSMPEAVGDVTMMSMASQVHHLVHHGEGDTSEWEPVEEAAMDLFEERFGETFGEATGHSH
jgi:hypothetical protein